MNSSSIKTQFYTWLSGKVSSKILSGLYLRMDDIDSHCIKNGITTIPLLETTNLSTILKVRTLVSQNKSFKLKHRKHAKDYIVIVDYYYEFIKDHYCPETSQTNDSQEAETINVQSADKTEDAHVIVVQERPEETKLIDYSNIDDLIGTTPVCFDYFGKKHLLEETTWKQLYIQVFTVLYEDYPDKISKMIGKRIANCGRVDLARGANKDKLVSPHYVGEDIYIETLQGTKDYIAKLKALLDDCLVDYENLQIYYLHKYQKTEKHETESAAASMNDSSKKQQQNSSIKSFDLSNIPKLKYTKPVSCELKDRFVLDDLKSWNQLYVDAVKELLKSFPHYIKPLTNKRFPGSSRIEIANGDTMIDLRKAVAIGTNLFIETNHSATTIAARLKYLILKCKLPLNSFSVNYISQNERPNNATINMDIIRNNNTQSDFSDWLMNDQKLSVSTARNYSSGISVCESFMKEHAIGMGHLYSASAEEVISNTEKLLSDKQFQDLNAVQHNRLSASLNKYSSFRETTALQNKSTSREISKSETLGEAVHRSPEKESLKEHRARPIEVELSNAIEMFVKRAKNGVEKEDICKQFPNYKTRQINLVLESNCYVNILGRYYHTDNISDYQDMAETLLEVILRQFSTQGDYTSAKLLYDEVRPRLDDFFFYNNAFDSRQEIYDFANHLFTKEKFRGFEFIFADGMHIWKEAPNYPKNYCGLLIKYAREHSSIFSREEAREFFEQTGSSSAYTTLSNTLLYAGSEIFFQYADNQFVLVEALNIDDEFLSSLQSQIEKLLEGEDYVAMGDIDDYFYETLPVLPSGVYWSALLLKEVLRIYNTAFETIEAGNDNDRKTVPAAIVRKNSVFKSFGDIVIHEVLTTYSLPKEFTATEFREFLLDRGFIRGSEKMWTVHKTVAGDIRFYWTDNNGRVTIN